MAGPQYPADLAWPGNVARDRARAAGRPPAVLQPAQRFTLNVTRADMIAAGWSPSVRLFEAAACGVPIISDDWPGLDEILTPGRGDPDRAERGRGRGGFCARSAPERRAGIAAAARARVLASHTAACRAAELEEHVAEVQPARVAMSA